MSTDPRTTPGALTRRRWLSGLLATVATPRMARAQPTPPPPAAPASPVSTAVPPQSTATAPQLAEPFVVDIHCHSFNTSDLPITGFSAHYVPYLSDLAQEVWALPDKVFRDIAAFAERLLGRVAPSPDAESTSLVQALRAASPVAPFAIPAGALQIVATEVALLLHRDAAAVEKAIDQIVQLLWTVSHGRAEVAATLIATYPTVTLFTPCLVDYDAWSGAPAPTHLPRQLQLHEMVSRLSMRDLLGGAKGVRLHGFVPFDPLREVNGRRPLTEPYRPYGVSSPPFADAAPYSYACPAPAPTPVPSLAGPDPIPALADDAGAIELVRHAVEQCGFVGVKLYPPVGFLPMGNAEWRGDDTGKALDRALRAFYAYCQAEEVPITVHASPANGYALGYGGLARPDGWGAVLAAFPRLRLNFGHFGHAEGTDTVAGVEACQAWIRQAALLIQDYPNVYADMSNSPLVYDASYARKLLTWIERLRQRYPRLGQRLMYGSDWWLNRLGPRSEQFVSEFQAQLPTRLDAAAVAGVMGRNALRFLGFIDDSGAFVSKRRNRARLQRYYRRVGVGSPPWLG